MVALIVVIVVIVLLAVAFWAAFNGLIKKRNRTREAWSEIDVELKRRHDLIPNLVTTVKGYAAHEQETFEAVTQARARCGQRRGDGRPGPRSLRRRMLCPGDALIVRGRRELPPAAGGRELPSAARGADGHRGQDRVCPPVLQHQRPGLQHRALQTFPRNLIAGPLASSPWRSSTTEDDDRAVPQLNFTGSGGGTPPNADPGNPPRPAATPSEQGSFPCTSEIASIRRRSIIFVGLFFGSGCPRRPSSASCSDLPSARRSRPARRSTRPTRAGARASSES